MTPKKKQKKRGRSKKRKQGAQPGHKRHVREPFTPEELDQHWIWRYDACPCCGGELTDVEEPSRTLQRIELPAVSVEIEQHDSHAQWCEHCQRTFIPKFPEDLRKAGLVGARLTALVGLLKGACHMSFSAIRKYFRDVIGVRISRGMLRKLVSKVSDALAEPLAEQAIRFVAIHRRLTQGTRGEEGRRWCERIWTVIQTCGQQQRSVFEFLCLAVQSHFQSQPAPSLVPDTS